MSRGGGHNGRNASKLLGVQLTTGPKHKLRNHHRVLQHTGSPSELNPDKWMNIISCAAKLVPLVETSSSRRTKSRLVVVG